MLQSSEYTSKDTYYPGTRVMAFDTRLYKSDVLTPPSVTIRPATVLSWYGYRSERFGKYPSLVDVRFDHDPDRVSKGHFANPIYIQIITGA